MLERLGRGAARHHWAVIGAWVAFAIVLAVVAGRSGGHTKDVFTIPGTESQQAFDLLQERFPQANGRHRPGRLPQHLRARSPDRPKPRR